MHQTLRTNFLPVPHNTRTLVPLHSMLLPHSMQELLSALQEYLMQAKTELLQPRQAVIDRILAEALR